MKRTKKLESIEINEEGYIRANDIAEYFSPHAVAWWTRTKTVKQLEKYYKELYKIHPIKRTMGRNGGTWMHPDFALKFLADLSPEFAAKVMRRSIIDVRQALEDEHVKIKKAS